MDNFWYHTWTWLTFRSDFCFATWNLWSAESSRKLVVGRNAKRNKKILYLISNWNSGAKGDGSKFVVFDYSRPRDSAMSSKTVARPSTSLMNPAGSKSLIVFVVLALCCILGFSSRLFAVIRFESIIHEFDPWWVGTRDYSNDTEKNV